MKSDISFSKTNADGNHPPKKGSVSQARLVQAAFYRGDHDWVLSQTVRSPSGTFSPGSAPWIVGALVFQGKLADAEVLYHTHKGSLSSEDRCEARFYLGVGFCRHSEYGRARQYFGKNLTQLRASTQRKTADRHLTFPAFFAYQGVGFYRYFHGRFRTALKFAKKSYSAALVTHFLFGKSFGSDLIGHCCVQLGEVSAGLAHLDDGIHYAKQLGDGGLHRAFTMAKTVYLAQHGIGGEKSYRALRKFCDEPSVSDDYSRANVRLELARQELLRGKPARAKATLDAACPEIYRSRHRRYGVLLSLRYASCLAERGDFPQALNLVRSAVKELDPKADASLEVEARGLESKILSNLNLTTESIESRIAELSRFTGRAISFRIRNRVTGLKAGGFHPGEDPLGDLLDSIAASPMESLPTLLKRGYLGLLKKVLPIASDSVGIVLDPMPGAILLFDNGEFHYKPNTLSPQLRAFAECLSEGEATKERLIETIWGYRYHPLRHDSLLHRLSSRFRKLLDEKSPWLESTSTGYRFTQTLSVQSAAARQTLKPRSQWDPPLERAERKSQIGIPLNYRQLEILKLLRKAEFTHVPGCQTHFKCSAATARRDLSSLAQLGYVSRIGRGRAIRYRLLS